MVEYVYCLFSTWCKKLTSSKNLVLEETLESPLVTRRSNQSILKEISSNIHWKDWCWSSNTFATWWEERTHLRKDPDAGKDWRQEKGVTEDEMVEWYQWLDEHEFEQTPGDGEGQGNLACCSSWSCKESDTTYWLNNNNSKKKRHLDF